MRGFDFFLTAVSFSLIGYILCYLTLYATGRIKRKDENIEDIII